MIPTEPMPAKPVEYLAAAGGFNRKQEPIVVLTMRLDGDFRLTNLLLEARSAARLRDDINTALNQAAVVAGQSADK